MEKSNWLTEEKITNLYFKEGLSAIEIGQRLSKNYSQVYKFMIRHHMPRRTAAQTHRIQFYKSPLSYSKKTLLSPFEKLLLNSSLMLYWAEGYKTHPAVDFANSDPKMGRVFLRCLREIYQVNEQRIKIYLYCYSNQDLDSLIKFWSSTLEIPPSQFVKPYVRNDFDPLKTGKMPHGLVHIRYGDRRLHEQIMADIDKITTSLLLGYRSGQTGVAVDHVVNSFAGSNPAPSTSPDSSTAEQIHGKD